MPFLFCVFCFRLPVPTKVILGVHNMTKPDEYTLEVGIKNIIQHPEYKELSLLSDVADVALAELRTSVELNPYVRPACLPSDTTLPEVLVSTIWRQERSDVLLEHEVQHLDPAFCRMNESDKSCNGTRNVGNSNRGGPLVGANKHIFCSYTVYGITSRQELSAFKFPCVYTNVFPYVDWIEEQVWPQGLQEDSTELVITAFGITACIVILVLVTFTIALQFRRD